MALEPATADYHGALVVVEMDDDQIVLIHPPGAPPDAPASLPSNPCAAGEDPVDGAVRIVKELTGLDVAIGREFVAFVQSGTPTGTMYAHGYTAHVVGGGLLEDGPEGPARGYRLGALPAIMPIRAANQRVLRAYLEYRAKRRGSSSTMEQAIIPRNEKRLNDPQPRRAVLDKARRKVERALAVSDAADQLANAAQTLLDAAEVGPIIRESPSLGTLRDALGRYRQTADNAS